MIDLRGMVNRPVKFAGTREQAGENLLTHEWDGGPDEIRCRNCDIKIWHVAADYPCGTEPSREWATV